MRVLVGNRVSTRSQRVCSKVMSVHKCVAVFLYFQDLALVPFVATFLLAAVSTCLVDRGVVPLLAKMWNRLPYTCQSVVLCLLRSKDRGILPLIVPIFGKLRSIIKSCLQRKNIRKGGSCLGL